MKEKYEDFIGIYDHALDESSCKKITDYVIKYHIVQQYQGYHVWHYEWKGNDYPAKDIVLAWHLSLTSHKNEGELEFKYYDKRIEPEAGRLLIWPAGFTHTHRGNCIRSDTQKHYMTGWWFSGRIR